MNGARFRLPIRFPIVALACLAGLSGLSAGCGQRAVEPPLPPAVEVVALREEPVTDQLRYSATVREQQRVELSFKVPGAVKGLLQAPGAGSAWRDLQEGDVVSPDPQKPLAWLDDSDYRRRLATATERLAQAKAKQKALEAARISANKDLDRVRVLFERNVVSRQARDDAQARKDATDAEVDGAGGEIRAAEVALQQAQDDLAHCALAAPFPNATVAKKHIEGNERIVANQPVFTVMDLSKVRAAFGVPDTQVDQFRPGRDVTVLADAFRGESFRGRVTKTLPAADPKTRTFEVEVTIDPPRSLRPGMVVTIVAGQTRSMALTPMNAVRRGAGKDDFAVFVVEEEAGHSVVRQRRVRLGGVYDQRIEVLLGEPTQVRLGDRIVAAGAFRLSDGQAVRVTPADDVALPPRI